MKEPRTVSKVIKRISELMYNQARERKFVLPLGSNYSIGIGTVSGVAKAIRERHSCRGVGVLWIDAHANITIPETSLSGRIQQSEPFALFPRYHSHAPFQDKALHHLQRPVGSVPQADPQPW
ncbi:Arginase family protein [Aspergillus parasiticus SU-1]|uniref:Arginase family protein n=1 Tax=Aspergillus parasiticus (strain ATCC 56775 / NRRL 5862 / SRRC 143 / SU-1) TaxID=1403190 RepID=A0A0F0I9H6_ASPPU|nr:Arginase family protein [Aspergillus parasiticus SU-1]